MLEIVAQWDRAGKPRESDERNAVTRQGREKEKPQDAIRSHHVQRAVVTDRKPQVGIPVLSRSEDGKVEILACAHWSHVKKHQTLPSVSEFEPESGL